MQNADLTESIIGAATEVHRELGPGLVESAYQECLCHELSLRATPFRRDVAPPVVFKSMRLDCGDEIDLVVADQVIVELKAVAKLIPLFEAPLLTYMRLSAIRVGLLINFQVPNLKQGIRHLILKSNTG